MFSCDFTDEADADCSGINMGSAIIDECGRCIGENTGFVDGHDKDVCGTCFGNNDCTRCNDIDAINYIEIEEQFIDNDLCIYDICETFPDDMGEYPCNNSVVNYPYQVGDQLSCSDLGESLDICFPSNCDSSIKLGDFYGKVIWMEVTSSW